MTVSNAAFPTPVLETLCWKQAVSTSFAVETVRFQHSVSNVVVGNTALETMVFQFCVLLLLQSSSKHDSKCFMHTQTEI